MIKFENFQDDLVLFRTLDYDLENYKMVRSLRVY